MNPKNDLAQPVESRPALSPAPRKRFRMEKLEERIAPHKWLHNSKCIDSRHGTCWETV